MHSCIKDSLFLGSVMFLAICMYFTDIGDSAVTTALVAVVGAYLFIMRCPKSALFLVAPLALSSFGIGLIKVAFLGCGAIPNRFHIASPSGHAALSLAVFGTLTLLTGEQMNAASRRYVYAMMIALVSIIAATRVILGFHSAQEVIVGLLIGEMILLALVTLKKRQVYNEHFNSAIVLGISVVVVGIMHGHRLPSEEVIHWLAHYLRHTAPCAPQ